MGAMTIVEHALELVPNESRIGLGSGRAAEAFVKALGERVRHKKLRIQGVPTSDKTAGLAQQEGIPLLTLAEAGVLDLTVDGADEVGAEPRERPLHGEQQPIEREPLVLAQQQVAPRVVDEQIGGRTPQPPDGAPQLRLRLREVGLLAPRPGQRLLAGRAVGPQERDEPRRRRRPPIREDLPGRVRPVRSRS